MRIVVLTGAGISAESGIPTFRGAGGLWEGHRVDDVASPEGWLRNPELVLHFYNLRRKAVRNAIPNRGHLALSELQDQHDVRIITQNIDDLHERAGSKQVMHLHGEILKVRSSIATDLIYDWTDDLHTGDLCALGSQLRPHIVWFGEEVPMMEPAIEEVMQADMLFIIGTSMVVYPAASLLQFAPDDAEIFFINPVRPEMLSRRSIRFIDEPAGTGVDAAIRML
ncbi:MAG: Sir2 family NAD-dependent protein deacetylase [Chitinophagales bacterium]